MSTSENRPENVCHPPDPVFRLIHVFFIRNLGPGTENFCTFFLPYTRSFLDIGRELSEFLNFSALECLVSYKPVSYKKRVLRILTVSGKNLELPGF